MTVPRCPTCEGPAYDSRAYKGFTDRLSFEEYRRSGMCQGCQDAVFGAAPDEDAAFDAARDAAAERGRGDR